MGILSWLLLLVVATLVRCRDLTFNISRDDDARSIVVNGNNELVKPVLRLRNGEQLNLKLENYLKEPTGVHFHGMLLENYVGKELADTRRQPAVIADGVPGVTQSPVGPMQSYWQNMTIAQSTCGTFWWHSHYAVQYGEGFRGPVIVECDEFDEHEKNVAQQFDLGERAQEFVFTLSDWYRKPHNEIFSTMLEPNGGTDPHVDGSLFNGKQDDNQVISVDQETQYLRLRILNIANSNTQVLHITGHKMIVIETDGVLVKPVELATLSIATGQRYTVLVKRDAENRNARVIHGCGKMMGYITKTHVLQYSPQSPTPEITSKVRMKHLPDYSSVELYDVLEPLSWKLLPDPESQDRQFSLDYEESSSSETMEKYHTTMFLVNGRAMNDYMNQKDDTPLILSTEHSLVQPIDIGFGGTVDIAINSITHMRHPWHLHGHHFQVISTGKSGYGPLHWDDKSSRAYQKYQDDLQHWKTSGRVPMTRDSINLSGNSFAVIRIAADSPGLWILHCHVDWHMVKGLGVVLQEGLDQLPQDLAKRLPASQDIVAQVDDSISAPGVPQNENPQPGAAEKSTTHGTMTVLAIYSGVMLMLDILLYKFFISR